MKGFPDLGCGLGLRPPQYDDAAAGRLDVDWFEVITENFMVDRRQPSARSPRGARATTPSCCTACRCRSARSIRSTSATSTGWLRSPREIEPAWVSDHLCWSSFGGHTRPRSLAAALHRRGARPRGRARACGCRSASGAASWSRTSRAISQFAQSTLREWEFLAALVERADCGLLLDVNNVYVSAHNHGFDAAAFIDGMPAERVGQIHLAGHRREPAVLLDTHDHPVREAVWDLLPADRGALGRRCRR